MLSDQLRPGELASRRHAKPRERIINKKKEMLQAYQEERPLPPPRNIALPFTYFLLKYF
ncbi:Hypothetical protein FKW44_022711 [Caligus rogercresseyi]|uniref:Uncharacterized protein n=1 Tax=Caligus rogercresseyi TaxID=217165 RepID=A0A7T8GMX2_CALRO|nr:Hypothetical protein FKW44_022711 [Caligus rogercresseyi]